MGKMGLTTKARRHEEDPKITQMDADGDEDSPVGVLLLKMGIGEPPLASFPSPLCSNCRAAFQARGPRPRFLRAFVPLVCQDKSGCSCEMKGAHHVIACLTCSLRGRPTE